VQKTNNSETIIALAAKDFMPMNHSYKYKKIDAFTAGASLGNPAACIYLGSHEQLSAASMLDIARQHKGFVSEVVYCANNADGIHLVYYSSECEVDFCGHGTIACMYSLIKDTPALLAQKEISIQTNKKGRLTVYNEIPKQDAVLITAPQPRYIGSLLGANTIAKNLGVERSALDDTLPIDLIDAGLRTLLVPLRDLETEISVFPHEQELKDFCIREDIDIILIFSRKVADGSHIAHTRVFAPKYGYLEDPATGSGNSAFGYYMLKNDLWDATDCIIEQGGNDRVFNNVYLSYRDGAVLFGGSATVRIDDMYML
jgi:PhzF family phenazine biosynthesis protein